MSDPAGALGLQRVELPEGRLRGRTFHYSTADAPLAALTHARTADGRRAVYRLKRLTASYVHLYFPSDPAARPLFRLIDERADR